MALFTLSCLLIGQSRLHGMRGGKFENVGCKVYPTHPHVTLTDQSDG